MYTFLLSLGPVEYEKSLEFIKKRFKDSVVNQRKQLYVHETCANDTNQVQSVLNSVTAIIINMNMGQSRV